MTEINKAFSLLGISPTTDSDTIKKAYRKQAKKYHPDTNEGATADRFHQIKYAYEYVMSSIERIARTKTVTHPKKDLFLSFPLLLEPDIKFKLTVPLPIALKGGDIDITYISQCACDMCMGFGGVIEECGHCNGSGVYDLVTGFVVSSKPCPYCSMKGYKRSEICPKCVGVGFTTHQELFRLNIPFGITDNHIMRIESRGNTIFGNKGALIVHMRISTPTNIKVEHNNILITFVVSPFDIILRRSVDVDVLGVIHSIPLPEVFYEQWSYILKHKGIQSESSVGDIVLKPHIDWNVSIAPDKRDLLLTM